jgi:two-component system sensor histidine kinase HydH
MPDGGLLKVVVAPEGQAAVITMTDSGPGFAKEDLSRVFDPFYTTRANGSGLGLSVCRKIAEGYGGSISAENGRSGGAVVALRLPLSGENL